MTHVSVTEHYDIDAPAIWKLVSQANAMDKYLPEMIVSCDLESNEAGGKRVCKTEQGIINETIVRNDHENMIFVYSIDNDDAPLPVSNYLGTVTVKQLSAGKTEINWSASFKPAGIPEEEIVSMLEHTFQNLMANIYTAAKNELAISAIK